MSTQEDRATRTSTVVSDPELTARLLAFLQTRAGTAPALPAGLPAADPALVERLRAAHAAPRRAAGPRRTAVPGPRGGGR